MMSTGGEEEWINGDLYCNACRLTKIIKLGIFPYCFRGLTLIDLFCFNDAIVYRLASLAREGTLVYMLISALKPINRCGAENGFSRHFDKISLRSRMEKFVTHNIAAA